MSNSKLDAFQKAEARDLHAADPREWNVVNLAVRFNISETTIYAVLGNTRQSRRDASARANRLCKEAVAAKRAAGLTGVSGPSVGEIRQRQKLIPADTRNFTQRFFGDPLPGRSALDQRQQAG